ncbi:MAG: cation transporter [Erysipelotrichaceae bacterium]|nr:cation transporter [Erysipelotrichaceae bacterium]
MFEWLCKTLIKDHQNTEDEKVRESYGVVFSLLSIFCNTLMVIFKLIVSVISNSIAIRADALNNLSDVASNMATLFGFRLAAKHADADHPYGHGRMEYVSGMIVSFLILLVGLEAIRDAVFKILKPVSLNFSYLTMAVLLVSIAIKLFMAYINDKAGKRIDSPTLTAAAADSRNDALMTSAAFLSLAIFKLTGINSDAWIGLIVSVFVLKAGIGIFRDVLDTILGKAPDKQLIEKIEKDIRSHEGVLGIHDLILHDYGPGHRFMSLHCEVDAAVPIMETHDMIDNIEVEILNKYKILTTIHMDPIDTSDEQVLKLREEVREAVKRVDPSYNIHDFRIVKGVTHTNLVFDVLIPAEDKIDHETLKKSIFEEVSKIDPSYRCVIQVDHSFV